MCLGGGGGGGDVMLNKPLQFIVDQVKQSKPCSILNRNCTMIPFMFQPRSVIAQSYMCLTQEPVPVILGTRIWKIVKCKKRATIVHNTMYYVPLLDSLKVNGKLKLCN